MSQGIIFALLGCVAVWAGVDSGGLGAPVVWLGVSFLVVACSYLGLGAGPFGKRKTGTLHPVSVIVLLPYLLLAWLVWHGSRVFRRIAPYNTLRDDIIIGRRLLPAEVPDGVDTVLDLTCEFPEPAGVRSGRRYFALPVLDQGVPALETLLEVLSEIRCSLQGRLYIHCAEGHGRTAMVAAVLLLRDGVATSPDDALRLIQQARPTVRLSARQRDFVAAAHERLAAANS